MESNYFTKCADDTTLHIIGNNVEELVSKSKAVTEKPFARFCLIEFKTECDKCYML